WFIRGAGEAVPPGGPREKFPRALFGWAGARQSALCASSTPPQLSCSGRGACYFRLGEVLWMWGARLVISRVSGLSKPL
uniref:Uncharacterized protein n=1 Tax=Macaca mulatta TaxID=9544 RepID=A0A5F8AK71_MACMU